MDRVYDDGVQSVSKQSSCGLSCIVSGSKGVLKGWIKGWSIISGEVRFSTKGKDRSPKLITNLYGPSHFQVACENLQEFTMR